MNETLASPILTIVLATKNVNAKQFNGCVVSIASLWNSKKVDLVIVNSGILPKVKNDYSLELYRITVINDEPLGVYSAYNRGLEECLGIYVMFMGVDDLVLPGLDRVIEFIMSSNAKPDLIAACSLMQDRGISKPSRIRGALIFRNWCHQGLLYHRHLFETKRFDIKYKIQADHKFNLELLAKKDLVVIYRKDVISHFSSSGASLQVPDLDFRAALPSIVKQSYGRFFWLIAVAKRKLADIIKGPPECRKIYRKR